MDMISYSLSKKVAASAVSGVQSMSVSGQTLTINTKDSGVLTMTFPTPKDGVSVTDIDVNANNQIVFTMSDGTEFISGKIPTVKGDKGDPFKYSDFTQEQLDALKGDAGFSPTAKVEKVGDTATITITDKDGTTTATIKDGQGGTGGSGEENKIDSISVNGVNVVPDENKNVDITVPSIEGLTKDADLATVAKSGNYEDLSNKPAIPSVEGLAKTTDIPTKVSQLENDSNYLSSISEEYVTETELEAKGYLTEHQDISGKVDKVEGKSLISDTEIARLATVDNYDDTDIKAEIAKKADTTSIPRKVSVLENDSKYQTESDVTTTLSDYATKTYVGEQIANVEHLKREIVTVLPSDTEASDNIIYMLKVESTVGNDKYQEYMKIDGTVQMVGDTSVDLTNYAKTADVNDSISALQTNKADASDLTAHTDDADIHVTADDKTLWNTVEDKVDKTSIATALDDSITDEQVTSALLAKTELDKKIDKTSIATELSDASTDDEVVGALTAYNELQKLESANKEQFNTASGESITVNDSVDGKIRDLKLYGKSEQKQYIGKNLLNATLGTSTSNGVTCTANGDGTYTLNGTASIDSTFYLLPRDGTRHISNGTYYITGCLGGSNASYYIQYQGRNEGDTDNTVSSRCMDGTSLPFEITEDTKQDFIIIRVISGTSCNNIVLKPMLTTDTSATYDDFEPYTGGIPSPNPDYPQEIKSVVNPVVKVCGENTFDVNVIPDNVTHNECTYKITDDNITINATGTDCYVGNILSKGEYINNRIYIPVKSNTKYRVFITNDLLDNNFYNICDSNKKAINNHVNVKANNFVITTDKDTCYINLRIGRLNSVNGKSYTTKILVYEPYTEQTATLPYTLNAIPVESGGNVTIDGQEYIADYVDIENKKLVRRVKKKDLGEFDWNYVYNVNPKLKYFDTTILDSFKPTASHPIGEGFCDSYSVEKNNIPQSDLANNKVAIGWLNLSSTRCCLEIRDDNYTNALDFKNAVKGRYIYYQLATQETIDLTDEQVQVFKELQTYYPTTNVFVTSDQLNGYADVKYPTTDVSGIVSNHDVEIEKLKKADTENFNALEQDIENQFSTASGDYITVNDSVDGNIIELGVKGNSFQQTYSGKNLLSKTNISYNATGLTITDNKNGTYSITSGTTTGTEFRLIGAYNNLTKEIHLDTSKTYKFTAKIGSANLSTICVFTDGSTYTNVNSTQSSFTLPDGFEDISSIFIRFDSSASYSGTLEVMLYEYTEGIDETFEPYVGGTSSPNPNYPQTINSVGDDGSLVIKSENKNILNIPDGSKDSNGITTTALNGRITCSGTSTAKFADVIHNISILFQSNNVYTFSIGKPIDCDISIKLHDSNGTALSDKRILKGSTSITFTAPENVAKATFYIAGFESGTAISISDLYLQVEKGDVATLPVLHEESTTTIPLSEPLRSIGDIKDEITYQNGKWGVLRRIGSADLGNFDWTYYSDYSSFKCVVSNKSESSICNKYTRIINWSDFLNVDYAYWSTLESVYIKDVNGGTDAVAFKELMQGTILQYELATSVFEPFADQTLQYLSTYDGVTNISNDDALSAEMTVKYPTTDASGVGSRNESRIAELSKDTDDKFDDVNESLSVIGKCKNLLNPKLETTTKNGVTCTNNGDGTYTLNGTASRDDWISFCGKIFISHGKYKFIGSKNNDNTYLQVTIISSNGAVRYVNPGDIFTIEQGDECDIGISTRKLTFDNILVKPMITTDLSATYDDFVPYTGEGETLASDVAEIKDDLGGLTFSASGTTLTITNGTNTWTLEANS